MALDARDAFIFNPLGAHTEIDPAAATALTPPAGATKLLIQAVAQNVRFTLDGSDPTAAAGFQIRAGDPPMIIPVGNGTVVKVIREAAGSDAQYQWGS